LTDSHGRTVDFRNTVVIMTSNIGSPQVLEMGAAGAGYEQLKATVPGLLQQHFRPAPLNRIDDVIVFHALATHQVAENARIQLQRLQRRLDERRMTLDMTPEAMEQLALVGYDPVFGARPLKRVIRERIETPLAKGIIAGEFSDGDTIRVLPAADGGFNLTVVEPVAAN